MQHCIEHNFAVEMVRDFLRVCCIHRFLKFDIMQFTNSIIFSAYNGKREMLKVFTKCFSHIIIGVMAMLQEDPGDNIHRSTKWFDDTALKKLLELISMNSEYQLNFIYHWIDVCFQWEANNDYHTTLLHILLSKHIV